MAGVHFNLEKHGSPPHNGVRLGRQNDGAGVLWSAVAHTEHGDVPGKATSSGQCYYGINGQEQAADDFSYVVCCTEDPMVLVKCDGSGPPPNALRVGHQSDGAGELYAAVAVTDWGYIPGKAKDNSCWYGINNEEHEAQSFYWVCHLP